MKTTTSIAYPTLALFAVFSFALLPQAGAVCQDACPSYNNTVQGDDALSNNESGTGNTAIGFNALLFNVVGNYNTAIGSTALADNNASLNTAVGSFALQNNTSGQQNTASGGAALFKNTTGSQNTASGENALLENTSGIGNTADGQGALSSNTFGSNNTAAGREALKRNRGSNNIAVGSNAGSLLTTGSNNIDIFDMGIAGEANTIRIGTQGTQTATFIAGISGATVPIGVPVIVDSTGHLGTTTSSARFKEAIKPMDKASEAILALKPVTFHYKHDLDPDAVPQFGLVAEEVEKVNPDLVARDEQGKPYTVRYDAVNAMLLNEFLKAHRRLEEQAHVNQQQQAAIAQQQSEIRYLESQLEKVNNEVELLKPARQVVTN
jgi:hypothetical protein